MSFRRSIALIPALVWLFACGNGPKEPVPAEDTAPPPATTTETFTPPPDGKLSPEQVEMYIAVRTKVRGSSGSEPADELESLDMSHLQALASADAEAAKELGHDPDEYEWVAMKIAEVRAPAMLDALSSVARSIAASVDGLSPSGTSEEKTEAAGGGEARPGVENDTEARSFNAELLSRYGDELDALEAGRGPTAH